MQSVDFGHGMLYCGDCLEVMPKMIEEHSIDMIFADLPYTHTDCHWDIPVNLTDFFNMSFACLKNNGVLCIMAQPPFTYEVGYVGKPWFRHSYVWIKDKCGNFIQSPYQPPKYTEDILIFSQCGFAHNSIQKCTYNPQKTPCAPYIRYHKPQIGNTLRAIRKRPQTSQKAFFRGATSTYHDKYLPNYIYIPVPFKTKRIHPTQKPVELMEYFIKTYANENDTILDPVIGSGTTAISAYNTGRKWIGIEKDPKIFEQACLRIERETQQQNIFNEIS